MDMYTKAKIVLAVMGVFSILGFWKFIELIGGVL